MFLDQFFDANPLELFSKFHTFIFMVYMDRFSKDKEEFIIQVVDPKKYKKFVNFFYDQMKDMI